MNKIKNYIIIVLFAIVGILLLLRQCGGNVPKSKETFLKGKETIKYDTIPVPYKVVEFKTKWYPKYDTITRADTTWDASLCQFERTYSDSTSNDSITIYSKIKTIGLLKSSQISYRWKVPSVVKIISRTDTLVRPSKWQFFLNSEVGGNLNQFNASVGADLIVKKIAVGYRYGVLDKTHNVKIGFRLLKSRK